MQHQRRRNRMILGLVALGLLAGVALMAHPAKAADALGPFYAEPAWDRKLACSTNANCPRFVVLTNWNNEAVLDKETGLVWEKSPAITTSTWSAARLACTARTTGNRKGQRLPSVHELASLVLPSQGNPALPTGHLFTNVLPEIYWTATTDAEGPTSAWFVDFFNGDVNFDGKTFSNRVWCVRGGMNADAY